MILKLGTLKRHLLEQEKIEVEQIHFEQIRRKKSFAAVTIDCHRFSDLITDLWCGRSEKRIEHFFQLQTFLKLQTRTYVWPLNLRKILRHNNRVDYHFRIIST